jgi:putative membrane protein
VLSVLPNHWRIEMRRILITASALALAACGGEGSDPGNVATAEGSAVANGAAPGTTKQPATPATAANGQQYVALVSGSDLFEIEAARVAQQKSQRDDVRELAGMILADHQGSTADLGRAGAQAQPPLSVAPVLNAEQQANLQALRAADGEAFDRLWLRQQVRAHEQALTLVTAYAANGDVEPLRRHAATVAEPIQRHLTTARRLEVPAPR